MPNFKCSFDRSMTTAAMAPTFEVTEHQCRNLSKIA